ncbi:MAG TPA: DivIVA domain-containing protein [Mycobacteriales bacterium]|jgi:DivIVA domain-containing protein|nr:DivIVA domain-containing protein [Mycobacteriales bacterium]
MPLTPADVHNVAFKKPPIGKRGYDEDEVDAFLDLIEAELARLIEENNDLKQQVDDMARSGPPMQGGQPLRQPPPPPEPMPMAPPPQAMAPRIDENSQVVKVLAMAQETAEKYVSDAKTEADRMIGDARSTADRMIGEARSKADAMVGDARTQAASLEREARGKATSLVQDAERKHNEIIGGLEQRKAALDKSIEGLRTFEREYRTRLKSYLESQLRDLDGRGSAEPATVAAAAGYAGGYGGRGDGDGRGD